MSNCIEFNAHGIIISIINAAKVITPLLFVSQLKIQNMI